MSSIAIPGATGTIGSALARFPAPLLMARCCAAAASVSSRRTGSRGRGSTPKLRLAGRLDGAVDGRPVSLVAERQDLVLTFVHWRTLLTMRRGARSLSRPLRAVLSRSDIRWLVRIRWLGEVEVQPKPSVLIRMLVPAEPWRNGLGDHAGADADGTPGCRG